MEIVWGCWWWNREGKPVAASGNSCFEYLLSMVLSNPLPFSLDRIPQFALAYSILCIYIARSPLQFIRNSNGMRNNELRWDIALSGEIRGRQDIRPYVHPPRLIVVRSSILNPLSPSYNSLNWSRLHFSTHARRFYSYLPSLLYHFISSSEKVFSFTSLAVRRSILSSNVSPRERLSRGFNQSGSS